MTAFLPPNLLALFAARDPLPFLSPHSKLGVEKKRIPYNGIAQHLNEFEDPKDTPPPTRVETKDERKERKRKERAEQIAYKLEQDLALWDPNTTCLPNSDPYKSLFVARINYDTSESKLRREFEVYGPVRKISLAHAVNGKPRGYAFIEYEHERDMHSAYKHADGKKIDGRRVLVDVERGRTVKGWRPRRLGGGLGGTRKGGPDENTRFSGRDDFSGGGYREDRASPVRRGGGGGLGGGGGGGVRRSRSREREPPRRRSRSRERRRSRSRERPARRERSKEREEDDEARKSKRRRSRSREHKRSRSRDRKKSRRSRSRERRDRREGAGDDGEYPVKIKEEKEDAGYAMAESAPGPENDQVAMETNGIDHVENAEKYES